MTRIIVRGFKRAGKRRALIFQRHYKFEAWAIPPFEAVIEPELALLRAGPHMIEFEFPDLPEAERFFRMGTDPSMMTLPIALKIP